MPVHLLLILLFAAPSFSERVVALQKAELKRLEIELADADGGLHVAVRIERTSEIRTFLDHLAQAKPRKVLVLGGPAPAVARVVVVPEEGSDLVVEVTARAFRVGAPDAAATEALVFGDPALLRWLEDRLEMPQYALREDLAGLRELFVQRTGAARAPLPAAGGAPAELAVNGGFEKGGAVASGWDPPDRLTVFLVPASVAGPNGREHGRVLSMDTDVYEAEWLRRKQELATDPDAAPWRKTPVPPAKQYATVGATYGVSCYGAPIPVRPGQPYRVTVDFRACAPKGGVSKIWVRGYGRLEVRGKPEWRRIYDSVHTLRTDDADWHTFTNVFHPTKNKPAVERMRVMLYSYWPRGEYRWDNVSVVAITPDEYRRAKATERADVK